MNCPMPLRFSIACWAFPNWLWLTAATPATPFTSMFGTSASGAILLLRHEARGACLGRVCNSGNKAEHLWAKLKEQNIRQCETKTIAMDNPVFAILDPIPLTFGGRA